MNLATATPREIDEKLADLYRQEAQAERAKEIAAAGAHRALGEHRQHASRNRPTWPTTDDQAIAKCRDRVAAGHQVKPWDMADPAKAVAAFDTATTTLAALAAEQAVLDAEFTRRGGWSRFFVVPGGHIHCDISSRRCSRQPTTDHGWNPKLSGKTEAEAVAELGPHMCTVCFPTAPVEWTVGKPAIDHCPGSTKAPTAAAWRVGMNYYGKCSGCGESQTVTQAGRIRKHQPPKK
jgi:hypothetical protein